MEDGDGGVLSTGITAFHTQLVSDVLWVVFRLLPVEVDPVSWGLDLIKSGGESPL